MTSDKDVEKEVAVTQNGTEKASSDGEPEEKKPVYSDDEDSSDEEDDRELQGRTYSEKGVEVRIIFTLQ